MATIKSPHFVLLFKFPLILNQPQTLYIQIVHNQKLHLMVMASSKSQITQYLKYMFPNWRWRYLKSSFQSCPVSITTPNFFTSHLFFSQFHTLIYFSPHCLFISAMATIQIDRQITTQQPWLCLIISSYLLLDYVCIF